MLSHANCKLNQNRPNIFLDFEIINMITTIQFLTLFSAYTRCGSRTGGPSGARRRRRGAALASWRSTACMAPWCATRCRFQRRFSRAQRTGSWTHVHRGFSVRYLCLELWLFPADALETIYNIKIEEV